MRLPMPKADGRVYRVMHPFYSFAKESDRVGRVSRLKVTVFPPKGVKPYTTPQAMELLLVLNKKWTDTGHWPEPPLEPWAEALTSKNDIDKPVDMTSLPVPDSVLGTMRLRLWIAEAIKPYLHRTNLPPWRLLRLTEFVSGIEKDELGIFRAACLSYPIPRHMLPSRHGVVLEDPFEVITQQEPQQ